MFRHYQPIVTACIAIASAALVCAPALAVVIVDENFESYTTEAELHAVWGGLAGGFSPGTPAEVEEQFNLIDLAAPNADFNGDMNVNAGDYTIWRDNLGLTGSATQGQGDANGDTNVDMADYDAWAQSFGTTPSGGGSGQALHHLINFVNQDVNNPPFRVPDGNVVYQPPLDPNFQPDNSIFPSDGADPIVLRGDIFSEAPVFEFDQRNTIALRSFFDGASANLVEMGLYNDAGSQPPAAGAAADGSDGEARDLALYGIRLQLFQSTPGPNPDWQFFAFDPSWDDNGNGLVSRDEIFAEIGAGWHRFEVTITPDPEDDTHDFTFTVDLLRDGMNNATGQPGVDATLTFNDLVTVSQAGFNSLRLGGPSGLYTTQAALFDNIFLSGPVVEPQGAAIPEPASLAIVLIALGGLANLRRSRR